jgi:uncharacterized protein (DUF433 family)
MSTQTTQVEARPTTEAIEHIVLTPGTCGGKARIAGTRIRVEDIYIWHVVQGKSPHEIVSEFPQLTLGDVYAAMAYYWDHRDEIQKQITEAQAFVEEMKRQHPSKLQEELRQRHAQDNPVPPG